MSLYDCLMRMDKSQIPHIDNRVFQTKVYCKMKIYKSFTRFGHHYIHLPFQCPLCVEYGRKSKERVWIHSDCDCGGELCIGDDSRWICSKCGEIFDMNDIVFMCDKHCNDGKARFSRPPYYGMIRSVEMAIKDYDGYDGWFRNYLKNIRSYREINDDNCVALVCGNVEYPGDDCLYSCVRDAKVFGRKLRLLGFNVEAAYNRPKESFEKTFEKFCRNAQCCETAVVYFSGHGIEKDGITYLVPIGKTSCWSWELEEHCINVKNLIQKLDDVGVERKIFILQLCRVNPFWSLKRLFFKTKKGISIDEYPNGTIIVYDTLPGKVSYNYNVKNHPYMQGLLHALDWKNIPMDRMLNIAKRRAGYILGEEQVSCIYANTPLDFIFNKSDFG